MVSSFLRPHNGHSMIDFSCIVIDPTIVKSLNVVEKNSRMNAPIGIGISTFL